MALAQKLLTALFTKLLAPQPPSFAWYYATIPLKNVSYAVNGSWQQERSPESVLYGGGQDRGVFTKVMNSLFASYS